MKFGLAQRSLSKWAHPPEQDRQYQLEVPRVLLPPFRRGVGMGGWTTDSISCSTILPNESTIASLTWLPRSPHLMGGEAQFFHRSPPVVADHNVQLGRSFVAGGLVIGGPIWVPLAGSGGVYILEEDLADVLVVARLQLGAKDVSKNVVDGCGMCLWEVVQEGGYEDFLGGSWP